MKVGREPILKCHIKLVIDALLISAPKDPQIVLMALEDLRYFEDELFKVQNDHNH